MPLINRRVGGCNLQVVNKANVMLNYNKVMGGIDRGDSYERHIVS